MKPYKFKPYLKSVIWGGDKIAKLKGIANDRADIGESWEISGIAGHESICAERGISPDPDLGLTLYQLIDKYRASLVGHKVYRRFGGTFPLLVKFIDSRRDLSIQVHPNDELARRRHNCAGKTEMWYIMHAEPGAKIYTGLTKNITPEEYEQLALKATDGDANPFAKVMATYESHEGDCYFLPAGRLHAIGAGNLLAEIQQTSDITYRVYDYGRRDADGHTRELHVEQAKEAIDYHVYRDYRTNYNRAERSVELASCPYFKVRREVVDGAARLDYRCDSFVIVVCLTGNPCINGVEARQGETLLAPACNNVLDIQGTATLLTATV